MKIARFVVRTVMTAFRALAVIVLLVLALPLAVVSGFQALWRWLDLWAFYDGDEYKRQKAEWDGPR